MTDAAWFTQDADAVVAALGGDPQNGLTSAEAAARLASHGPNAIAAEPAPSVWQLALKQLADPMNIMLVAVAVISFFIDQTPVGVLVGTLVILNVVLGTRQELKAQASVDALAKLQIPRARVVRDGTQLAVPAVDLVPGDIVSLEAGDLVPADGRLLRSATLETQEAALTGESAPIAKDPAPLADPDTALGDQTAMVFQNTQVTRGTATMIVTETGMATQMGRIASMLSAVVPGKSPLQRELGALTRVLGIVAWSAVGIIVVLGLLRGQELASVILVAVSMAISAIPTGMPTFVQGMLSHGSKQLADHRAIVKNLADVETLGATSAINSDKTGTLTLNEMTVQSLYFRDEWFTVSGGGYAKTGELRGVAGAPAPDFTALAYGLCLCSDATVSDAGAVVGDPTEAALVVLAAKIGADAELTRRTYPRVAEVPFDSAYKFMATFHRVPWGGERGRERLLAAVKGGPDVVLARCDRALTAGGEVVPIAQARERIEEANRSLSEQGLRVLAFAYRDVDELGTRVAADPMSTVEDLVFTGLVGIIDPLRPSSVEAVRIAHEAGIEVRMITGDHAVTASAIGAQLGLGPGAASGAQIQAMSDDELRAALPGIHVFGRVTPEDKLRLARLMQEQGDIVAMTGDAVNDAAALKQADIGVAMGSGSEVTKQAGNMILTDDNFGTLVTAIRLGRAIYEKIVAYVRFQMSLLFSLVLLFLAASVFSINDGVPLTPLMVLFLNFFTTAFPLLVIMLDPVPDDIMSRPPRDPKVTIARPAAVVQWLVYGTAMFLTTLVPLLVRGGDLHGAEPSVPVTMAFVVASFGAILGGLTIRRDPGSGLVAPIAGAARLLAIPAVVTVLAVELDVAQRLLGTVSLTGGEWLLSLGLALVVPIVVETEKAIRRAAARER
ncbi:cation-translocating P-type ATPase [Microbacterium sp. No. 7]|uniref:cation-translocating P-type ATPase n=1 Tax=Microbacterium sp. No. 7 TaxID=1714373 RepID=UPI0006D1E202|nr:cation-translocating P-type ATPase [Microbacterium sp. No. 7]ALJ22280.1 metal-transporting ATPase [Microbacterium sp. No. 7]